MRIVVQRVKRAKCIASNEVISAIEKGYLVLVGFTHQDTIKTVEKMARKLANLRIFSDSEDKMNLSIKDINGSILLISQFTLYGDAIKGNRPSFIESMDKNLANELYLKMIEIMNQKYQIPTYIGSFGNHMELDILCDGPVTINIEMHD